MKNGKNNNKKGIALSLMALAGLLALNTPAAASDNVTINDPIAYASTTNIPSQYDIFKTIGEDPFANLPNDIKWEELSAKPSEGTTNVIEVKLPNNDNRYYQYDLSSFDTKEYAKKYEDLVYDLTEAEYISAGGIGWYNYWGQLLKIDSDKKTAIQNALFKNIKAGLYENSESGNGYIINNEGIISDITADFIENKETMLLKNTGTINSITGNFIANENGIMNYGTIENITGNFIENKGSDICNHGTIKNITANYINNNDVSSLPFIANNGLIENIVGNFIDNKNQIISNSEWGSTSVIKNITGNFIGNTTYNARAAIDNNQIGLIGNITGNFIGNSHQVVSDRELGVWHEMAGGAIQNKGTISNISGNFIGNNGHLSTGYGNNPGSFGGAIYNSGVIGKKDANKNVINGIINSTFKDNYATAIDYPAKGGAIYSTGDLNIIADNGVTEFTGNYVQVGDGDKDYQAIFMDSKVKPEDYNYLSRAHEIGGFSVITNALLPDLNLIAKNNGRIIFNDKIAGSAIGTIDNIYAYSNKGTYYSGEKLKDLLPGYGTSTYYKYDNENKLQQVYNYEDVNFEYGAGTRYTRNIIDENNNTLRSYKILIQRYYIWDNKLNTYVDRYIVQDENGNETTYRVTNGRILDTDGNIIENFREIPKYSNSASYLYDYKSFDENDDITSTCKYFEYSQFDPNLDQTVSIIQMLDNENNRTDSIRYLQKTSYKTIPEIGYLSIYTYQILDDDNNITETYNIARGNNGTIYLFDENDNIIKEVSSNVEHLLLAISNPITTFSKSSNINIDGDPSGTVLLNNNIEGYNEEGKTGALNINLRNTNLHLANRDNVLDNNNLNLYSGTLNMINGQAGVAALNSLTLKGNTNFVGDVDLKTETMDRFTAKNYGQHSGFLNVVGLNITDDMQKDKMEVSIPFAESGLKDNVMVNGSIENTLELPNSKYQLTAYTPIYKYNVTYDNKDDMGYFVFARGGKSGGGNVPNNYNPAVLASPVSIQAASNASINETFKYVFEHADAFTQLPSTERLSLLKENQYALSTDFNQNLGYVANEFNNKSGWFRPYVTFENMHLKNGPTVDAITYGSLVGFDSDFQHYKHGWTGVTTGYIGYNGSQLSYGGVDTSMNGGLLGLTQTLYKGNFWTALTLSAGANVGESNTMYGKEDFTSLLAGIGSKTGYNFEFKEGKFIIQPIMFLSYTFVNTFDYTNAAGVKINSDPMHSILLNPSIRFITNTKNGWQPYLSVGMVWNVMNENQVFANNVKLPEMSIKPYVEYGLGIQKRFKDNFTAFGQAMIRNGGRNGISLTSGIRWSIGKSKNVEKVQHQDRKVIKTL